MSISINKDIDNIFWILEDQPLNILLILNQLCKTIG
jgi:hypothetical protein